MKDLMLQNERAKIAIYRYNKDKYRISIDVSKYKYDTIVIEYNDLFIYKFGYIWPCRYHNKQQASATLTDTMDDIEIQLHQDKQITSPSPSNFMTYASEGNITTENDVTHGSPLVDWPRIWLQGVFICIFGVLGLIGNF